MKFHPAALMAIVWLTAITLFHILPFALTDRVMSLYGYLILATFISVFCIGALAASRPMPQYRRDPAVVVDFRQADQVIMVVAGIAIAAMMLDISGKNVFDLAGAYTERSSRADDLLRGQASDSSIWFQLGFLTYPVGFVAIVREIGFRSRLEPWRVAVFGFLPILLAALAMGGRGALLFAILFAVMAYFLRRQVFSGQIRAAAMEARQRGPRPNGRPKTRRPMIKLGPVPKALMGIGGVIAMIYFIQVFFVRADVAGGVDVMFGNIGLNWGVTFNGRFSGLFYSAFGVEGTYIIFVFAWYALQGLVMGNAIFTDYNGPMLFGTYGIDLMSALMRRLNGEYVADGFDRLLRMNVYGFLPSAFGSLYVDLKFFGLIPCFAWGWLSGLVYRRARMGVDPRWLLIVPFVTFGVVASIINTPIGLSNGLMVFGWMMIVFYLSRRVVRAPSAASNPRPARPYAQLETLHARFGTGRSMVKPSQPEPGR